MKNEKEEKTAREPGKGARLLWEFMRYVLVGGVSALVDIGVLWLVTEWVFDGRNTGIPLAVSVAAGFVCGLAVNWLLSNWMVFTGKEQRTRGRSFSAFLIYAAVGLVGFGLTELLMHLGMLAVSTEGLWYLVLNVFVKGVVLIWNYAGRKIFVYRGK
ncbi:MAG: GtrA family protein [Clostridia bacterium]|nr:GtrA family protein [Clostridia bacterium]